MTKRPVALIVEDEFLLRSTQPEIEDTGFEVVKAGNADEAIAILKASPDIRVVFTDSQMPGSMDGLKRALCPGRMAADQDHCYVRSNDP
jgi:two-component system, response regulator PdtaR